MATRYFLLFISMAGIVCTGSAQDNTDGIAIGTNPAHKDAILDIQSTTQGLLLPRYAAGINEAKNQRSHPVPAEPGMIYYDKAGNSVALYNGAGGAWTTLDFFPVGAIAMWSGGTPPSGWSVCDGTNDTPDLRERFIVGFHAGDPDYNDTGKTGGASTVTLTEAQLPQHTHAVTDPGHSHVASLRHHHTYEVTEFTSKNAGLNNMTGNGGDPSGVDQVATSSTSFSGTVNIGTGYTGLTVGAGGGAGQAHNNMPPYYVLAFIMRKN